MTRKPGSWIALEDDNGNVYTGVVTSLETDNDGTHYDIDVLADGVYRSRVERRGS